MKDPYKNLIEFATKNNILEELELKTSQFVMEADIGVLVA